MQLKYVKPVKNIHVREVKLLSLNIEFEFVAWLTDIVPSTPGKLKYNATTFIIHSLKIDVCNDGHRLSLCENHEVRLLLVSNPYEYWA